MPGTGIWARVSILWLKGGWSIAGSAVAGDYGYEPLDAVHVETNFPEYSELYFTNHGPVVFLDEDDNVTSILDHSVLTQLAAAHSSEAKTA